MPQQATVTVEEGQITESEFNSLTFKLLRKLAKKKDEEEALSKLIKDAPADANPRKINFNDGAVTLKKDESGKQHISVEGTGDTLMGLLTSLKELAENRTKNYEMEMTQHEMAVKQARAAKQPDPKEPIPPKKIIFEIGEPSHLTGERLTKLLADIGYIDTLSQTVGVRVSPEKQKKGSGPVTVTTETYPLWKQQQKRQGDTPANATPPKAQNQNHSLTSSHS